MSSTLMDWGKLLSKKRLQEKKKRDIEYGRRPFQRDFDRIIFSESFRRLQDKTQVFPLAESDYVRTRLTHSLESSSVARSLGTYVGMNLKNLPDGCNPYDVGDILAAATLAHDIGNPPLGHSGEDAVKDYFKKYFKNHVNELSSVQESDLVNFEGNAQGFRILTRLHMHKNLGGLRLTTATLATFTKYPQSSNIDIKDGKSFEKFGFFESDKELFKEVAEDVGLIKISGYDYAWCRHPLAFLLEAADDICYTIIDFEDGIRLGHINYTADVESLLLQFFKGKDLSVAQDTLGRLKNMMEKVSFLRSIIINRLVEEVADCFLENENEILSGDFNKELVKVIPSNKVLLEIKKLDIDDVYTAEEVIEIEAAGFELIDGLLSIFIEAVNDISSSSPSSKSKKILQFIPKDYKNTDNSVDKDPYKRILKITDFVSGMTDSYAVATYKKLKGISLPSF